MNRLYDSGTASASTASCLPDRDELPLQECWDLEALYGDEKAWRADVERVEDLMVPLESLRGALRTPADLAALFAAQTALDRLFEKIYLYAHLRADEDTGDPARQARLNRVQALHARLAARLAWIDPEILARSEKELRAWTDAPELAADRYAMQCLLRRKAHTLSAPEERLLARTAEVMAAPARIFGLLNDADLRFPEVTDDQGKRSELTQGRYPVFLLSRDRRVRRQAFTALFDTYGKVRHTLAGTLSTQIKTHNLTAEIRGFDSALEAALHPDQVPPALYQALIDAVHAARPCYHGYMELRRRRLGLEALDMYDLHVPLTKAAEIRVPFTRARDWILAACRPLGEAYTADLEKAFEERWIDRHENRGKRSGAYSAGCYDSRPYILANYQERLDDVFTLAHELGHSMHTLLANRRQQPRYARYTIFVGEIASTFNEALLLDYLLREKADDQPFRTRLLNHLCDAFKGTVFRQTQFAEFEKQVHEQEASGQALTADFLSDAYARLNAAWYGPAVRADARIGMEWARIPHFYYHFYVYKYATSFCASQALVRPVLAGDRSRRDRYLELLSAGGSDDPLELVKRAGVDLLDAGALSSAFQTFSETVDQLAKALQP